ncbi:MAG: site-2 protease family protein [Pseudomonadota bacterium]
MDELSLAQKLAVWALPVIFAITVHEVAHGWVAMRLGDNTARAMGRLTLNPIKHIDIVGTLVVPAVLLFLGGFLFGWAKPVPVNWRNLRHPKTDMIYVAAAGPLANLFMALLWLLVLKMGIAWSNSNVFVGLPMVYTGYAGILINLVLMVLNMLPIPPLDGSRVLAGLLPNPLAYQLARLERFGLPILILLLALGWLGQIIGPPVFALQNTLYSLAGIL